MEYYISRTSLKDSINKQTPMNIFWKLIMVIIEKPTHL